MKYNRLLVAAFVALFLFTGVWYMCLQQPISFVLLEGDMCRNDEVRGLCKVYMVENFSKIHEHKQIEDIKRHAIDVTKNYGNRSSYSIYYFKDCKWTRDTRNSFRFKPINEIARWDENISIFFPSMPDAFICRIYFKCLIPNKCVPEVSRNY